MPRRKIDDVGGRIEGARKDRFKGGLTLAHLADLTPKEAEVHVTKDAVWPAPDYAALISAGMPVDVAAFVKMARDRMPTSPTLGRDPSGYDACRRDFVTGVTIVRDFLLARTTLPGHAEGHRTFVEGLHVDYDTRAGYRTYVEVTSQVRKDRHDPHVLRNGDRARVARMVAAGFPGAVPAWLKGVDVKLIQGTFHPVKGKLLLVPEGFATRELAEAWLKARHEAKREDKAANRKERPARPHLDDYSRTGLAEHRAGSVTAEDFAEGFGFYGAQFGNWLPDDERQRVLDMAHDAFCDLADVLGLPRTAVGLDGRLGFAFGARGQGGALATYESTYVAINLTRLRGGGSVAHEWAHAFDHWAGEVGIDDRSGLVRSGSGWREPTESRAPFLLHLDGPEVDAWEAVMRALTTRPRPKADAVAKARASLDEVATELARVERLVEQNLAKPAGTMDVKLARAADKWLPGQRRRLEMQRNGLAALEARPEGDDFGRVPSLYLEEARKLCGKSGEYWARPNELFARAFEAFVFDKLAERGGASPYLVQGVEEARFASDDYEGNPYPTGEERRVLAERFDALVDAMRHRLEPSPAPTPC